MFRSSSRRSAPLAILSIAFVLLAAPRILPAAWMTLSQGGAPGGAPPANNGAKPKADEPPQPSAQDQKSFVEAMKKIHDAKGNIKEDDLKKALQFADAFDTTVKETSGKPLGDRLTKVYAKVKDAKDPFDTLTQATLHAKSIEEGLGEIEKVWKSFAPFKDKPDDIKDETARKALAEYVKLDAEKLLKLAKDVQEKAGSYPKALSESQKSLAEGLDKAANALGPIKGLPQDASGELLRTTLAKSLGDVAAALVAATEGSEALDKIQAAYDSIDKKLTTGPKIDAVTLHTPLMAATGRLRKLLATCAADLVKEVETAQQTLDRVIADPFKERVTALGAVKTIKPMVEDARSALKSARGSRDALAADELPKKLRLLASQLGQIDDQVKSLSLAVERLDVVGMMLQEPNPVNVEQWAGEYVNLYYFDDVPRLMNVLLSIDPAAADPKSGGGAKQVGGISGAASTRDVDRKTLITSIEELADKRQELNDKKAAYEKRRIQLRESLAEKERNLAQATRDADREEAAFRRADNAYDAADLRTELDKKERGRIEKERGTVKSERDDAEKEVTRTKAEADADPANKQKQDAYRAAKAKFDRLDREHVRLDRDYDALDRRILVDEKNLARLKEDRDAAETKRNDAKGKKDNAETAVGTAKGDLNESGGDLKRIEGEIETATGNVRTAMRNAYLNALAENASFATARDNQPFWQSRPHPFWESKADGSSDYVNTDPVQRVFLFGFPDSKTIFIRGRESDVQQVRELIATFDRPMAQALMTLWSLEISSQSTNAGAEAASKQIRHIEDEMRVSRAQTDASLTLMRKAINDAVSDSLDPHGKICCKCGKCPTVQPNRDLPKGIEAAVKFYDCDVFVELELADLKTKTLILNDSIIEALIPDPRGTTTLAEALIVLSLAKPCYRAAILRQVYAQIVPTLVEATENSLGQDIKRCKDHSAQPDCLQCFPRCTKHGGPLPCPLCAPPPCGHAKPAHGCPTCPPECPKHKPAANCAACRKWTDAVMERMPRLPTFAALIRYCGPTGDGAWIHSVQNEVIYQLRSNGGREIRRAAARVMEKLAQQTVQIDGIERRALDAARECDEATRQAMEKAREEAVKERLETLCEGESLLIWARVRPKPDELRDYYEQSSKTFLEAISAAMRACANRKEADAILKAHEKAQASVDELHRELREAQTALENAKEEGRSAIRQELNLLETRRPEKRSEEIVNGLVDPNKSSRVMQKLQREQPTVAAAAAAFRSQYYVTKQALMRRTAEEARLKVALASAETAASQADTALKTTLQKTEAARSQWRVANNATLSATRDFRSSYQLAFDNAREAAANETIKRALKAVDEDLHHMFIDPMLDRVRKRLNDDHVSVGVFQRTQVIASNRLVAKVDPIASSTLNLAGTEFNALQEVLQLSQFVGQLQAGPALPALAGLQKNKEKETPPSYYGITTGNTFRVTPILDPTGQALRFRFDHVLRTAVREPSGSIDPQLNRIEQMSVNTEVQLSNHEIGRVSSFQSNQKLGRPTEKSGGIPILKHIPILNEIPLIGWFSRRNAQAAVVQQSLLLGQTAIFPTIGDVVHLLTKPMPDMPYPQAGECEDEKKVDKKVDKKDDKAAKEDEKLAP